MVELLGQRASAFFICIEITKVPSWRGNLHFLSSLPSLDTIILHNLCPPDGFKKCFILLRVFLIVDGAEQIFIRLLATVFLFLLPSVCALDSFYPLDSSLFSHWPWALRKPAAMGPFSVMHSADMSSHFAVNLWLCQRPFCLAEVLLCPAVRFVHPFVFLDILVALELSLSLSAGCRSELLLWVAGQLGDWLHPSVALHAPMRRCCPLGSFGRRLLPPPLRPASGGTPLCFCPNSSFF